MKTVACIFLVIGILLCMTIIGLGLGIPVLVLAAVCWGVAEIAERHEEAADQRAARYGALPSSSSIVDSSPGPKRVSNSMFGR